MSDKKKRPSPAQHYLAQGTHHPIFSVSRHRRPRQPFGKWVWLFWILTIMAVIVIEGGVIRFNPWQWQFAAFAPSVILLGVSAIPSFAPSCDPLDRKWGSLLVVTLFLAMAFSYVYVGPVLLLSKFLYVCSVVILFLFLRNAGRRFNLFIEGIVASLRDYGYMMTYGGSWVWLIVAPLLVAWFIWWPLAVLLTVFLIAFKGMQIIRGPKNHKEP
jgi:hypothetical protein